MYTNYWTSSVSPGAPVSFKFTIWTVATSGTRWEDSLPNRTVVWDGTEPLVGGRRLQTNAPPLYFDNLILGPNDFLQQDTLVTFAVDMTGAVDTNGIPFNSSGDSIFINGPFCNWNGWGGWWDWKHTPADPAPGETGNIAADRVQMTNNPVGGQVYTLKVLLPKGSPVNVQYKYSINGWDNSSVTC